MFVLSAGVVPHGLLSFSGGRGLTWNACNVSQQSLSIAGEQHVEFPSRLR
jgi:hypothetical protein